MLKRTRRALLAFVFAAAAVLGFALPAHAGTYSAGIGCTVTATYSTPSMNVQYLRNNSSYGRTVNVYGVNYYVSPHTTRAVNRYGPSGTTSGAYCGTVRWQLYNYG